MQGRHHGVVYVQPPSLSYLEFEFCSQSSQGSFPISLLLRYNAAIGSDPPLAQAHTLEQRADAATEPQEDSERACWEVAAAARPPCLDGIREALKAVYATLKQRAFEDEEE